MKIILANPRGFCAGVDRAIHIVEKALEKYGKPIYVRHEIVHNRFVVDRLRSLGAIFVEEVCEAPEGATLVFSAHGVGQSVCEAAAARNLRVVDAACPLVKRVHSSAQRHHSSGSHVILIGHAGHAEVEGTMGQLPSGTMSLVGSVQDVEALDPPQQTSLSYITQTTLSVEETRDIISALRLRFPNIKGPEKGDLCYATTNRQAAVRQISQTADLLLVVGAKNSSNSNRLRELGAELGVRSYLIADASDLCEEWFNGVSTVGVSSGASAPEILVQDVVSWIRGHFGGVELENVVTMQENVKFSLPEELRD